MVLLGSEIDLFKILCGGRVLFKKNTIVNDNKESNAFSVEIQTKPLA